MPIYEFECISCLHKEEIISISTACIAVCPGCNKPMDKVVSAHGGYKIKGDNSASTKPSQSGSFKGKK